VSKVSPFGAYAALVAAIAAVVIVAGYVVAILVPGLPGGAAAQLEPIALIAVGAIFGSAVTVNGWKQPTAAANSRLDRVEQAVTATASSQSANAARTVAAILERPADGPPAPPGPVA
jgi:hypothetical protein